MELPGFDPIGRKRGGDFSILRKKSYFCLQDGWPFVAEGACEERQRVLGRAKRGSRFWACGSGCECDGALERDERLSV